MNTRLQVEHPVTELTTGLDLVARQLDVADGGELAAEPPAAHRHAIEVRLYAEDPAQDWRPSSGVLHRFHVPGVDVEFALGGDRGLRLDSGVGDGSVVGVFYDPMLAKVIAWAPTRAEAARLLAAALAGAQLHGLTTNRDLLVRVLRHEAFLAGDTDTAFFDRHGLQTLAQTLADKDSERLAALAAALADAAADRAGATVLGRLPSGWRNVVSQPQVRTYGDHEVKYLLTRGGLVAEGFDDVSLVDATPERVVLDVNGVRRTFAVASYADGVCVDSPLGSVTLPRTLRFTDPAAQVPPGSLLAPMPGSVIRLGAALGEQVGEGQPILWLEAMKMEHKIVAPVTGVLSELPVAAGDQVEVGAVLAVVTPEEDPS